MLIVPPDPSPIPVPAEASNEPEGFLGVTGVAPFWHRPVSIQKGQAPPTVVIEVGLRMRAGHGLTAVRIRDVAGARSEPRIPIGLREAGKADDGLAVSPAGRGQRDVADRLPEGKDVPDRGQGKRAPIVEYRVVPAAARVPPVGCLTDSVLGH